jgi:CheY-like chemotaxis protein
VISASKEETLRPRRVLVIDDNEDSAWSLAEVLKALGHSADALCDPSLALEKVAAFHPDIVFLDIGMPKIDGYTVAEMLRDVYPYEELKLVAVTAYVTDADRRQARKSGFDAHVAKPADFEIIESILKTIR